jgi:hypothetical protein
MERTEAPESMRKRPDTATPLFPKVTAPVFDSTRPRFLRLRGVMETKVCRKILLYADNGKG